MSAKTLIFSRTNARLFWQIMISIKTKQKTWKQEQIITGGHLRSGNQAVKRIWSRTINNSSIHLINLVKSWKPAKSDDCNTIFDFSIAL